MGSTQILGGGHKKIDQLILIDGSGSMSGVAQGYLEQAVKDAVAKAEKDGKTVKVFLLSDTNAQEATDLTKLNLMCGGFNGYSFASLPPETCQADRIVLITDGQVTPESVDQIVRFSKKTNVVALDLQKSLQAFDVMCIQKGLASVLIPAAELGKTLPLALANGLKAVKPDTRSPDIIEAERTLLKSLNSVQRLASVKAAQLQDNFSMQKKLQGERKRLVGEFAKAMGEQAQIEAALAALKPAGKAAARKAPAQG